MEIVAHTSTAVRHPIPRMFTLIRKAIAPFPRAMLFELYDLGFRSPYEQLIACLLSIRTRDEVSFKVARPLLAEARTPEAMLNFSFSQLVDRVQPCTFPGQKARTLLQISERIQTQWGGQLPCDLEQLTSLPGVGPKCANLVLGIACHRPSIGVDIHVHRVTNRWGYVQAPTPEKTLKALEKKLPKGFWVEINEVLVPFGKHICLGTRPKCSTCPVRSYCARVGVTKSQ